MKIRGQVVSYYVQDIFKEIEQFEQEESEYRAILAELKVEHVKREKAKAAELREDLIYAAARDEHVLLLKCEGLTFDQIGQRLGVSRERARQILRKGAYRLQRAMVRKWPRDRTRVYFEKSPNIHAINRD